MLPHLSTHFNHAAVLLLEILLEITLLLKLQVTIRNTPGIAINQVKAHLKSLYFLTKSHKTLSKLSQKSLANTSVHLFSKALKAFFIIQELILQRKIFKNLQKRISHRYLDRNLIKINSITQNFSPLRPCQSNSL